MLAELPVLGKGSDDSNPQPRSTRWSGEERHHGKSCCPISGVGIQAAPHARRLRSPLEFDEGPAGVDFCAVQRRFERLSQRAAKLLHPAASRPVCRYLWKNASREIHPARARLLTQQRPGLRRLRLLESRLRRVPIEHHYSELRPRPTSDNHVGIDCRSHRPRRSLSHFAIPFLPEGMPGFPMPRYFVNGLSVLTGRTCMPFSSPSNSKRSPA